MHTKTKAVPTNYTYLIITPLAVAASWFFHELAHWATGTFLGYNMAMTLNTAYPLNGTYLSTAHAQLIDAAGPLLTLTEAVLIFFIMRKREATLLYPFLFTCFYMRLLATIISLLNPNDEARISQSLGIGTFTLPLLVTAFLFVLLYKTAAGYGISKKLNSSALLLIMLFSSLIVLSDQFLKLRLI
jgi:hypothetical protein